MAARRRYPRGFVPGAPHAPHRPHHSPDPDLLARFRGATDGRPGHGQSRLDRACRGVALLERRWPRHLLPSQARRQRHPRPVPRRPDQRRGEARRRADGAADGPSVFNRQRTRAAYILHGDVFVRDLASGKRTPAHAHRAGRERRAVERRAATPCSTAWATTGTATTWPAAPRAGVAVLKAADDPRDARPGQLQRHQLRTVQDPAPPQGRTRRRTGPRPGPGRRPTPTRARSRSGWATACASPIPSCRPMAAG